MFYLTRAGIMNITMRVKALICGGGDLKSVTGETLTNTKWSLLASIAILFTVGNSSMSFFELFAGMSISIAFLRVLIDASKYPYQKSESGLESNEQIHARNNRFTHDFRMAVSASALSIFGAYIIFLLYYGVSIWQGFKFWFDYVGS